MANPFISFPCSAPACSSSRSDSDHQTEVNSDVPFEMVALQVAAEAEAATPSTESERLETGLVHLVSGMSDSAGSDALPVAAPDSAANRLESPHSPRFDLSQQSGDTLPSAVISQNETAEVLAKIDNDAAVSPENSLSGAIGNGVNPEILAQNSELSDKGPGADRAGAAERKGENVDSLSLVADQESRAIDDTASKVQSKPEMALGVASAEATDSGKDLKRESPNTDLDSGAGARPTAAGETLSSTPREQSANDRLNDVSDPIDHPTSRVDQPNESFRPTEHSDGPAAATFLMNADQAVLLPSLNQSDANRAPNAGASPEIQPNAASAIKPDASVTATLQAETQSGASVTAQPAPIAAVAPDPVNSDSNNDLSAESALERATESIPVTPTTVDRGPKANRAPQPAGSIDDSEVENASVEEANEVEQSNLPASDVAFEEAPQDHHADEPIILPIGAAEATQSSAPIETANLVQVEGQLEQSPVSTEPITETLSLEELLQEAPSKESIRKTGEVIKDAIQSSLRLDGKTVQLEIHPAELGALKIQVTQVGNSIETQIIATEFVTSELLLSHRDQLMETLADLGFKSSDVDISHEDKSFGQSDNQGRSKDSPRQSKTNTSPATRPETKSSGGLNLIA